MSRFRFTPEQVAEALRRTHGIQTRAARALGCSAATIRRYIHRFPQVRETYEQVKGLFLDRAELQLMAAVDRGVWKAVEYTLLTLGKDRGYVIGGRARPLVDDDDQAADEFFDTLLKAYGPDGDDGDDDDWDAALEEPADDQDGARAGGGETPGGEEI
jgi:hypothetical protein